MTMAKVSTTWLVIFGGIKFCDQSKEGSGSNFCGFHFRDCRTIGHSHQDPLMLVHVCTLMQLSLILIGGIFVTAESTTKSQKLAPHENYPLYGITQHAP